MVFVRATSQLESQDFDRDETNDLFQIISARDRPVTGGFTDAWDDPASGGGAVENSNNTPVKLHYYKVRVFTTKPCVLYSSTVENYNLARQAPAGADTTFNQVNIANNTVRKWTTTVDGGYWSFLTKNWTKRVWSKKRNRMITVGDARYMNNEAFKIQLKNIDPAQLNCHYYAIVEVGLEYDQASTG